MIASRGWQRFASLTFVGCLLFRPTPVAAQPPPNATQPPHRTVPGFAIADSSIMSVEHIDPLHATSITLFSTLRNDDLVPRDISVEFLPWLPTSPRAESLIEQYDNLKGLSPVDVWRNYFAVSLSISQAVQRLDSDEPLSQVALGFRTFLVGGRLNQKLTSLIDDYRASMKELDEAERYSPEQPSKPRDEDEDRRLTLLLLRSRSLVQEIANTQKNRVGFLLETGAAQVLRVPNNSLSRARPDRTAFWVTPIYRLDERSRSIDGRRGRPEIDFAGILRIMGERETDSRLIDAGGRVGVRNGGIYYSIEALGRKRVTDRPERGDDLKYGRVVGAVAYGFNRSTQVHFTFGKNFSRDYLRGGSLLASFGLTVGLGEIPFGAEPRND
jgi:hypothetical protein